MYKDRERQKEAVREATRRWRDRKGITKKVSPEAENIVIPVIPIVIPKEVIERQMNNPDRPSHHPSCQCMICKSKGGE